jgi:hypothetical protein
MDRANLPSEPSIARETEMETVHGVSQGPLARLEISTGRQRVLSIQEVELGAG